MALVAGRMMANGTNAETTEDEFVYYFSVTLPTLAMVSTGI